MYFIINKTRDTVVISDLKLELGPNHAIDLEKIFDSNKIDNSVDLRNAIKAGHVSLREKKRKKEKEDLHQIAHPQQVDIESIKKEVRNEMKEHMDGLKEALRTQPEQDQTELLDVLKNLTSALKDGSMNQTVIKEQIIKEVVKGETVNEDDDTIDPSVSEQIHAKAVKRLTENAVGKVEYKEDTVDGSVEDRASELDGLL